MERSRTRRESKSASRLMSEHLRHAAEHSADVLRRRLSAPVQAR